MTDTPEPFLIYGSSDRFYKCAVKHFPNEFEANAWTVLHCEEEMAHPNVLRRVFEMTFEVPVHNVVDYRGFLPKEQWGWDVFSLTFDSEEDAILFKLKYL